jgi:hypothetical protein
MTRRVAGGLVAVAGAAVEARHQAVLGFLDR